MHARRAEVRKPGSGKRMFPEAVQCSPARASRGQQLQDGISQRKRAACCSGAACQMQHAAHGQGTGMPTDSATTAFTSRLTCGTKRMRAAAEPRGRIVTCSMAGRPGVRANATARAASMAAYLIGGTVRATARQVEGARRGGDTRPHAECPSQQRQGSSSGGRAAAPEQPQLEGRPAVQGQERRTFAWRRCRAEERAAGPA